MEEPIEDEVLEVEEGESQLEKQEVRERLAGVPTRIAVRLKRRLHGRAGVARDLV